jgi:HEAT repeat protein
MPRLSVLLIGLVLAACQASPPPAPVPIPAAKATTETLLIRATEDPNPQVRWRSLLEMTETLSKEEVVAGLQRVFVNGTPNATWNAAVALAFLGSKDGLPLIHSNVISPDPYRRLEAIAALTQTHDESSAAAIAPLLQSPSTRDRGQAALALGVIASPEAVEMLIDALQDQSPDVRERVCRALDRANAIAAIEKLEEMAASDPSLEVRQAAAAAAAALNTRAARSR